MSLDRPTFPMVRYREGYDTEQVDLTVAMVRDNLALPQPRIDRHEIEELRFAPVRLRPGYEMAAVDDWLDEVVAELDRRGGRPVEAVPTPMPTATPTAYETRSDAIVEVAGPRRRWPYVLLAVLVVAFVVYYASFA